MKWRFLHRAWKARLKEQRLEIALARALIPRGALAVDAGANKGAYLYWLRQAVGAEGAVLAFEPQAELAEYLRGICRTFGWSNVRVSETALSNRAGKAPLHVPGAGVSPGASLESSILEHAAGRIAECAVGTLDQQLRGQRPLQFLKVDVEGHELSLFEGAAETLRRDQPVILFECEARHLSRHTMRDVFALLESLGFEGWLIARDHLLPVADFDPNLHQNSSGPRFWDQPGYLNNFLFGPPASLRPRLRSFGV